MTVFLHLNLPKIKSSFIKAIILTVKAMDFPVVMYRCESWTVKKAECRRIDTFKLWCRRKLLRVPWTAKRSNQSILKEINPEYSLEGLMLKLQYFGHLVWRADSLEKILMLRKIKDRGEGGKRRWDGWMTSPPNGHETEQTTGDSEGQGRLAYSSPWGCKESETTEQLNNSNIYIWWYIDNMNT